jgi:hypothetical protein
MDWDRKSLKVLRLVDGVENPVDELNRFQLPFADVKDFDEEIPKGPFIAMGLVFMTGLSWGALTMELGIMMLGLPASIVAGMVGERFSNKQLKRRRETLSDINRRAVGLWLESQGQFVTSYRLKEITDFMLNVQSTTGDSVVSCDVRDAIGQVVGTIHTTDVPKKFVFKESKIVTRHVSRLKERVIDSMNNHLDSAEDFLDSVEGHFSEAVYQARDILDDYVIDAAYETANAAYDKVSQYRGARFEAERTKLSRMIDTGVSNMMSAVNDMDRAGYGNSKLVRQVKAELSRVKDRNVFLKTFMVDENSQYASTLKELKQLVKDVRCVRKSLNTASYRHVAQLNKKIIEQEKDVVRRQSQTRTSALTLNKRGN